MEEQAVLKTPKVPFYKKKSFWISLIAAHFIGGFFLSKSSGYSSYFAWLARHNNGDFIIENIFSFLEQLPATLIVLICVYPIVKALLKPKEPLSDKANKAEVGL